MFECCEDCKYFDIDYEWDDLTEDEIEIEVCRKGHIFSDDEKICEDFNKYKPRKYKETFSECDRCKYLSSCGNVIESTARQDTYRHFVKGRGYCKKVSGEINEKKLSEIIKMADSLKDIDNTMIPVLQKAISKLRDITFEQFAKVDIFELMEK